MAFDKVAWQREQRRRFAAAHGYSTAADYATGGLRESVLKRDGWRCVHCGLPASEHLAVYGRPITVDHIDKDRSRNTMENLQTLCLSCHGRKDSTVTTPQFPTFKQEAIALRRAGWTYDAIAVRFGFSIGAAWKWLKRWEGGTA